MQKAIVLRRTPSASSRSINRTVTAILHSLTRDVAVHMRRDLSKTLAWLWRACLGSERTYRPDLHYMRGPGPAWHAKYGYFARDLWPLCTVEVQKVLPPSSSPRSDRRQIRESRQHHRPLGGSPPSLVRRNDDNAQSATDEGKRQQPVGR